MSDQKEEYAFGDNVFGLMFVVEEWWTESDYTEPGEHCLIWQEPFYHEYGIWQEALPIDNDIWHEPVYNDYEIWQNPNGCTDIASEIFQCSFDQRTAGNDSQPVSQEDLTDEFFIIENNPVTIQDLRYYPSRDDIIEPELVDQFNSVSPINEEEVVEEDNEEEFIVHFNDWINFDSINHKGFFFFFGSCKLIKLVTEI
ncbi:hypothetical protein BDF21DRAFT_450654 [Thamnidium elegans]|nr:hypothetical protein BDF21DRAFT_450654 [Thamnidium elegans]